MKNSLRYLGVLGFISVASVSFVQSREVCTRVDAKNVSDRVSSGVEQVFISNTAGDSQEGIQEGYGITDETKDSTKIESGIEVTLTVKAYPNPSKNDLLLHIINYNMQKWEYSVFDVKNRRLLRAPITSNETLINLSHFNNAVYFVRLMDGGKLLRNFKVVKQQ